MINVFASVAAYIRYSDHKQDDGFSIEYQTTEVKEYAARHGMEVSRYFIDKAQTATKVSGREAFFALINAVKKGEVKTIIVYKLSRMFRNTYESAKYRDLFRKMGVKLISVTQHVDEDTSAGRLTTNIVSSVDQYQSETTSDHVKSSMREMARQGYYTGGHVRYGYDLKPVENGQKVRKYFIPHAVESKVVKMIFEMSADGNSNGQIRNYLNSAGYKTKYGKPFTNSFVSRVIEDDMYIGVYRFKTAGYDDIVVPDGVPAIVEKSLWHKANAEKESRRQNVFPLPRQTNRLYSLTGKMICGQCGNHFTGYSSIKTRGGERKEYLYYVCKGQKVYKHCTAKFIDKGFIESETLKAIKSSILSDEKIKELSLSIVELCQHSPSDLDTQIKEAQQNKKTLEKNLDRIVEMIFDDENESPTIKAKILKMEKELAKLEMKLYSLREKQKNLVTPASVQKYMNTMLQKASSDDMEEIKTIFDNFVKQIIITDDKVEINLNAFADGLQEKIAKSETEIPVLKTVIR